MKLAKLILVILTVLSCFVAFSIYTTANATQDVASAETSGYISGRNTTANQSQEPVTQVMTNVGEVTSGENAGFGLSEALNTIIIAVGVIIILLSIAILIRLKQY